MKTLKVDNVFTNGLLIRGEFKAAEVNFLAVVKLIEAWKVADCKFVPNGEMVVHVSCVIILSISDVI